MNNIVWIGITVILLAADIFTKWLAAAHLTKPLQIWPGIFNLTLSYNTGIAFSIPIPNQIMIALTPFLVFILAWFIIRSFKFKGTIVKLSLALLIAGALGNFSSRIFSGAVIDFLDFSFWPSFNLADAYLTLAAFLVIRSALRRS